MTRKQLIKRTRYWQEKMGLSNWDILVVFKQVGFKQSDDNFEGLAKIDTNSQYKLATLYYPPKQIGKIKDITIIHEMLHCLLSPFIGMARANFREQDKRQEWLEYYHEQVTSELTRIIMRLRK